MSEATSPAELAVVRRAFARQLLVLADAEQDTALEAALAAVAREAFLGPPPWTLAQHGVYRTLAGTDPAILYQDALFALDPGRGVNNGSPSLHARWLHRLAPRAGERVVHVGAGTGYYTAILAHLVGGAGRVVAVEFDATLADQARANLVALPQVSVVCGDGAIWPQHTADIVYVNYSVTRPAVPWIELLAPGGRLIFPLGVPRQQASPGGGRHAERGVGLLVTRTAHGLSAAPLGPAFFVCAEGASAATEEETLRLRQAFTASAGGIDFVQSLVWGTPPAPERCWFIGSHWALCYDLPRA